MRTVNQEVAMEPEATLSAAVPDRSRRGRTHRWFRAVARALPFGLLGMIPFVWLVERHIAGRQDLSNLFAIEWKRTGTAPRSRAVIDSPVLCFGTSLTRYGVAPRVLEETLHLPAFNLALSGGQPFPAFVALRRALDAGARPRAIVVDFMWATIGQDYTYNERLIAEMIGLRECAELARAARDPSLFGRLALATILPSYRARLEVRANIDFALRGLEPNRVPERLLFDRHASVNRGAIHFTPTKNDGAIDPDHPVIFPKGWSCHPVSEHYIDEFLGLAESRGIPVFWLIPPLPPRTQARLAEIGVEGKFLGLVDSIRRKHPGVTILDGSRARYAPSAFCDMIHLNRDGAVVWSADVASAIARRLATPDLLAGGWDRLPDYRADPKAARVEDTERTQAILRAALDRVRR